MLSAALDLLAPAHCAGCRDAGTLLCPGCRAVLGAGAPALLRVPGLTVAAAHHYGPTVRAVLVAHKERGRRGLAGPLGECLARAVGLLADGRPAVLVPVPSRGSVRRARGFAHTLDLARAALPTCPPGSRLLPALAHGRRVRDQAGLSRVERARNLDGALLVRPGPFPGPGPGEVLVVVDDVLTTGATATAAVRALSVTFGSPTVGVAVIAAVRRDHSDVSVTGPPRGPGKD